jgi:hypothetical protein
LTSTLQRLLTHNSAAMTARYAHLADDALKRAAVAGGILEGTGGVRKVRFAREGSGKS